MSRSIEILEKLIAFPSISRTPNIELIEFVAAQLQGAGIETRVYQENDGSNANLHALVGPSDRAGVMLSGHTDVVPVKGQQWTTTPFNLLHQGERLYGRGTADMKGFVACAINAMLSASTETLSMPLQLALSYDEEIGCVGVRSMIDTMATAPIQPAFCIVGEPTELTVANGHKGKTALRAICHGVEAHSALAPTGMNAIHLAADVLTILRQEQQQLITSGAWDNHYDIPYTTIHTGTIKGGTALNIVPNHCEFEFEIRNIAIDNPDAIIKRIRAQAEQLLQQHRDQHPSTDIEIVVVNSYPGLDTAANSEVVSFVNSLLDSSDVTKVAFGTEGGLFSGLLGIPTVVCGPGSMQQGHKPDEYITEQQMQRCDLMLSRLVQRISV